MSFESGVCLADLAVRVAPIPGATPCREVDEFFQERPRAHSVVLACTDGRLAVLMRERFLLIMAGANGYGRALFGERAVERFIENGETVFPGALSLGEVERSLQTREPARRYDDLIVSLPDGALGVVSVADLLARLSRLYGHAARHDPLTGLANRAHFEEVLRGALRSPVGPHRPQAIFFIDIDRFKDVNDSLGHEAGDTLLVEVARRLSQVVRPADLVSRYAGDEFAVLLAPPEAGVPAVSPVTVAQRLLRSLERPVNVSGRVVTVGASVGIVVLDGAPSDNPEELVRRADLAMYEAKTRGGRRHAIYTESMSSVARDRLDLESGLREAIVSEQMELHYQPKVGAATEDVVGAEALLRWRRPGVGMVPPDHFIAIAEQTGLIVPIGRWVLKEACRQAAEWHARRPDRRPMMMCVNVSPRQLADPGFLGDVAGALDSSGLAPEHLCLEVTETMVAGGDAVALGALTRLRARGVLVAIDDFGVGHSSLLRLRNLPVDELKIDRSFVATLGDGGVDESIVGHILDLARTLGLSVTAEGVETQKQLTALIELNCQTVQGYLTGRPMPVTRFEMLLGGATRTVGRSATATR